MAPTVNKDVEETRRLAKESRAEKMSAAEIMSITLMDEAADGKASDMMVMLNIITARIILELSKRLGGDIDLILKTHSEHVRNTIRILKEKM